MSGIGRQDKEEMEINVSQYTGGERKTPQRGLVTLSDLQTLQETFNIANTTLRGDMLSWDFPQTVEQQLCKN